MYRLPQLSLTFMALGVFSIVPGCGARHGAPATAAAADAQHPAGDEHDAHDHDAHYEHDHDHDDTGHAELGPHGGRLIELGDDYHAELLHHDDTHAVTVYVLDAKAENTVAIAAPEITIDIDAGGAGRRFSLQALNLGADEQSGAFCFEVMDEALCHALDQKDSHGKLTVDINGRSFTAEVAADHHGHQHHHAHAGHGEQTR